MSGTDIEKPIRQQPAQLEHIAPAVDDFAFLAGIDAILRQFSVASLRAALSFCDAWMNTQA
jgi:hypothetical protein